MAEVAKGRTSLANRTLTLEVGNEAPDFTLLSHQNEEVSLRQFRGQRNVVVQFLVMAWTGV